MIGLLHQLDVLRHIPNEGDPFEDAKNGIRLTVAEMERMRIAQVRVEKG